MHKRFVWVLAGLILGFIAREANATTWNWSFAGESGQFVTNGTGSAAGTYSLIDFSVGSSAVGGTIGSLLGGQYMDGQFSTTLPYSFVYDGSAVTQWLQSGTNAFDWWTFDSRTSTISYFFGWDLGNINDPTKAAWWRGNVQGWSGPAMVSVRVDPTQHPVPEPATMLLIGTGLAGLAGSRPRKKR